VFYDLYVTTFAALVVVIGDVFVAEEAGSVAMTAGQVVGDTLGADDSFFGKYWKVLGQPTPSPTGSPGTNKPSATEPLTKKV